MGALILPHWHEKNTSEPDMRLVEILKGLREWVDHAKHLSSDIQPIEYDGVFIGYRVREVKPGHYEKQVLVKFSEPIADIPQEQKDPVVLACFEVFLQEGQGEVGLEIIGDNRDALEITQEFQPLLLTKTETAKTHIKIDDDIDRIVHETMHPWEN